MHIKELAELLLPLLTINLTFIPSSSGDSFNERFPEKIIIAAATEAVRLFRETWDAEKNNLPMPNKSWS